jgi:hypothetical protein
MALWRFLGHKVESSKTSVVVSFSSLNLQFYKMLFMNRLEFSCFPVFFVRIFKTREESSFLLKSAHKRDCE